jgi:hypothetical protein
MRKIIIALVAMFAVATPVAVAGSASATTGPQRQAIGSAHNYLSFMNFSKQGLIDQLDSPFGDGYSKAVATYAVNHIRVNWYKQAVGSARNYLSFMHFSCAGLIDQLDSRFGDKYTHSQAVYGAHHTRAC